MINKEYDDTDDDDERWMIVVMKVITKVIDSIPLLLLLLLLLLLQLQRLHQCPVLESENTTMGIAGMVLACLMNCSNRGPLPPQK